MMIGNFNAKIGKGKQEDLVGEYGLGLRNDRGNRLSQFCKEQQLIVSNTFYQPPRRF